MSAKITIISDVNVLVERYGITRVEYALKYIKDYPQLDNVHSHCFNDSDGNCWWLTDVDFAKVRQAYGLTFQNKITAMKVFRDLTGCSLRSAKDAIEHYKWSQV